MLVSTTMRAVTVQAFAISSITSTASRNERPWPPSAFGMVMPRKPASAQRLDDVPGVLLVAVDGRGARAHDLARKGAGATPAARVSSVERPRSTSPLSATINPGAGRASLQVNQSLGLTFYCSTMPSRTSPAVLLASAALAAVLALSAGGCSNIGAP